MTDTATVLPFRGRGRLEHVVAELRRQVESRVDFTVDTSDLSVGMVNGALHLVPGPSARDFLPAAGLPLLDQALVQLGERQTPPVPTRFLREAAKQSPGPICDYLSAVMRDHRARRFVRVLDGRVRAFLSDRYRVIESLDVVAAVLKGAQDQPVRVLEASVSDSHVRIKLVCPSVWDAVAEGPAGAHAWVRPENGGGPAARASAAWLRQVGIDPAGLELQGGDTTVWPVTTVANSDTGHGGFTASVGILQAICFNLATIEQALAHVHLGERMETGIFTAETVSAEARTIALKARDVIAVAFDSVKFRALVQRIRAADKVAVTGSATAMANVISLGGAFNERDLDDLVRAFGQERSTIYGVGQAVARLAQHTNDPEVAAEREALAGAILTGKHTKAVLAAPVA